MKTPWKLFTDRPPGCSQCEKDGAMAIEIENAEGKVILHLGHDTVIDEEFVAAIVSVINNVKQEST